MTAESTLPPAPARISAFVVHILTASGAALGLLALLAAAQADWAAMFLWLGAALIIDAVDGSLARRFRVAETLPRWSGDILDAVVDFTTYVIVPVFAMVGSGLLPPVADLVVAAAIVISAAIYFADREMKMPGNYFRGFPALWNAAAFYLFVLEPDPWIAVAGLAALVVLTFVPFRFIHPVRVRRWRNMNLALLMLWSLLALIAVLRDLDPGPWIVTGLCVIGVYFFAFGLLHRPQRTDADDA